MPLYCRTTVRLFRNVHYTPRPRDRLLTPYVFMPCSSEALSYASGRMTAAAITSTSKLFLHISRQVCPAEQFSLKGRKWFAVVSSHVERLHQAFVNTSITCFIDVGAFHEATVTTASYLATYSSQSREYYFSLFRLQYTTYILASAWAILSCATVKKRAARHQ